MTTIQQTYLQLLRQAIGLNTLNANRLTLNDTAWQPLVRLARIQGTAPLVFDQVLRTLPPTPSLIGQEGQMKQVCMQNMVAQEEMKAVMQKTLTALEAGNVHAVVFKGFALAQLYPNPYLRQWGDIDIYVGINGYHPAADILRKTWPGCPCFESEEDYFKHWNINVGHTAIEAHRVTIAMTHPRDKRIWSGLEKDGLCHSNSVTADGLTMNIPEERFNVLLVFIHSWHHYTDSRSANMKQVCDITMCLKHLTDPSVVESHRATIYLRKNLRRLRLTQVWQAYAWIMVEKLGLPMDQCPLYTPKAAKRGEMLLQRILEGRGLKEAGNNKVPSNVILRKLYTLRSRIHASLQLWEISPIYAIHDMMGDILNGMGRLLRGDINRKWE